MADIPLDPTIVLTESYLHALRECAYDWGIEPFEGEPIPARRAAIWLGRNVVTLIDELRRLQGQDRSHHAEQIDQPAEIDASRGTRRPVPEGGTDPAVDDVRPDA
jgi:hypothetical protein